MRKRKVRIGKCICAILSTVLMLNSVVLSVQAEGNSNTTTIELDKVAVMDSYATDISGEVYSTYKSWEWDYTTTPQIVGFFDYKGNYNVVYSQETESGMAVCIKRYDEAMNFVDSIQMEEGYTKFGNATCDREGNYYIVWGQDDEEFTYSECIVLSIAKYDYAGNKLGECNFVAEDTEVQSIDDSGTWKPFWAGNCSVAINSDGVLVCNFARQMFNVHQSNYVVYVNCDDMTRAMNYRAPYCSHAFDQRVISLSDGNFLVANHGDAYPRAFMLSYVKAGSPVSKSAETFHFREGGFSYNQTFAQLGDIAEAENSYVICGSSERTLSLEPVSNKSYYNESRDLFVQILKKDFYNYTGAEQYYVSGETRLPVGEKPESAYTEMFLEGDEVDYGIIWLTDYEDNYYANNPKMIVTDDNKIVVMWEKSCYADFKTTSYYVILNEDGSVYQDATEIEGVSLAGNISPTYRDGRIYWITREDPFYSWKPADGGYIHCLDVTTYKEKNPFYDISENAWHYQYSLYAYKNGLMTGMGNQPDGTVIFKPDDSMTREMFVQVLHSREGKPKVEYTAQFSDVADDKWYTDAIMWAAQNGITSGNPDGTFGVGVEITREQMATMLYTYANVKGYDTTARAELTGYVDTEKISTWAMENIQWAIGTGIMSGKPADGGKKVDARNTAIRAECATMLKAFISAYE